MVFRSLIILSFFIHYSIFAQSPFESTIGISNDPESLQKAFPWGEPEFPEKNLPAKVDLGDEFDDLPVISSKRLAPCVIVARILHNYIEKKRGNDKLLPFSEEYNCDLLSKTKQPSILESMMVLWEKGGVPLAEWNTKKSEAGKRAKQYKIYGIYRAPLHDLNKIKRFLFNRNPIPVNMMVFAGYSKTGKSSVINSAEGPYLGSSAIMLVGYDDSKKAFKFLSTWGSNWGDEGYGWISYKWFMQSAISGYVAQEDVRQSPKYVNEIVASYGSSKEILLAWEKVPDAFAYEIHRKRSTEKAYKKIGISLDENFKDSGVKQGVYYHYKVAIVYPKGGRVGMLSYRHAEGVLNQDTNGKLFMGLPGLKVNQSKNDGVLTWSEVPSADSYIIYKFSRLKNDWAMISKTKETSYKDSAMQINDLYKVKPESKIFQGVSSEVAWLGKESPRHIPESEDEDDAEWEKVEWNTKTHTLNLNWPLVSESLQLSKREWPNGEWNILPLPNKKQKSFADSDIKDDVIYQYKLDSLDKDGKPSRQISLNFVNSPGMEDLVQERSFVPDNLLVRLQGGWSTMVWDGKGVRPVRLEIIPDETLIKYDLKLDNKKVFSGEFHDVLNKIEESGKFKMELSSENDALYVEWKDKSLFSEKGNLSFMRE